MEIHIAVLRHFAARPRLRERFSKETLTFQAFLCVIGTICICLHAETPFQENTVIFRTDVE